MDKKNLSPIYNGQQRGESGDYDRYFAAMDKTMQQKLAFTTAHFLLQPGAVIADMGCGSGLGSFQYAQMNPHISVVGIDINPETIAFAREKYKLPNLRFETGDIEKPDPALGPFDGILNSSVLHHVYTFNGYDRGHVVNALKNQFAALKTGGTLIIRDFVAWPEDQYVILDLSNAGDKADVKTMSDADLLVLFSQTARPLNPEKGAGFFVEELDAPDSAHRRFRLSAKWANEFILRKDYRQDWDVEVLEEYSWWTKEDYARELAALGGRVVYTAPFWNSWIVENRFRDKIRIYDEAGQPLDYPPTNFIAVCEKLSPGDSLHVGERALAVKDKTFLSLASHRNATTGEIYDMAARPGDVRDLLPYRTGKDGRLYVFARHGYPRPLANTVPRGTPSLDFKRWSGHMIEPVAVALLQNDPRSPQDVLAERLRLPTGKIGAAEKGLRYYSSPALVNEAVESLFIAVEMEDDFFAQAQPPAASGFSASGDVRAVAAQDLLRAAQVGMLPEARLELNIYRLMQQRGLTPEAWLGSEMLPFAKQSAFTPAVLSDLLATPLQQAFRPVTQSAGYLRHLRAGFADTSASAENARQELEFVIPAKAGMNVASVLPVVRGEDGELYAGLEARDLPAPQALEGSSRILVTPAYRLPNSVVSIDRAGAWLAKKMGIPAAQVRKLGEGYFSSIGITPERVFPFIAEVDPATVKDAPLHFVKLRDIFTQVDRLRDAHLMIAGMRAVHALGLWKDYAPAPAAKARPAQMDTARPAQAAKKDQAAKKEKRP